MLNKLSISNYAIIDKIDINFLSGFSTITGETGSGKSIILGALNLLFGTKFESLNFKDKSSKTIIEGVFDISDLNLHSFFKDLDLDYDSSLIIRREFIFQGKSRSFINDTPVKLVVLKKISTFLVDIHSQHENLLLHNEAFQVNLLDRFCMNNFSTYSNIFDDYTVLFREFQDCLLVLQNKRRLIEKNDYDLEYYKSVIQEVESLNLSINEKENLEIEYKKLTNLHEIKNVLSQVIQLLEDSPNSVLSQLNLINTKFSDIIKYDASLNELTNRVKSNKIDINDITMEVHTLNHQLSFDVNRLEFIENRLNHIYSFEKKLNVSSIQELLEKVELIKVEIDKYIHLNRDIDILVKREIELRNKLEELAQSITFFRKKSAITLVDSIKKDLFELGIENPDLLFSFSKSNEFSLDGIDQVTLFFSANKGYEMKPLIDVASGGEIARLMLCVKKYFFGLGKVSTIIFDEIDSGVSGSIARKMGRILQDFSQHNQVICITHSPQIASLANLHYRVQKSIMNDITTTEIRELTSNDRVQEVARMLSGDDIDKEAVANAKKMLDI